MSQVFDAYSKNYSDAVQSSIDFSGLSHDFFMRAKARLLREIIAERMEGRARPEGLDAGCGVGKLHPLLSDMFSSLSGVDVSGASIEEAKQRNPAVSYASYDGKALPYGSASFDLVFTICVVHHVPVDEWQTYVGELRRVTRPGGLVCIIEHNPLNPGTRLAVARCEFDRDAVLLRSGKAKSLMKKAGLSEIESRFFLLAPFEHALALRAEKLLRRLPLGAQYATIGRV